jgi:hypothetical protein
MRVGAPPRSDGYRPVSDALWVWARILGFPPQDQFRLVMVAGRRLDSGHRQIERVRAGLKAMPALGSPAGRTAVHDIVGDADLAVIAIDKALDIVSCLYGRFGVRASLPAIVATHRPLIASLRDHHAHIDERAVGRIRGRPHPDAEKAFEAAMLIRDRVLTDGTDALSIDADMTELLIATRTHLVRVWEELVERARKDPASA